MGMKRRNRTWRWATRDYKITEGPEGELPVVELDDFVIIWERSSKPVKRDLGNNAFEWVSENDDFDVLKYSVFETSGIEILPEKPVKVDLSIVRST